MARVLFLSVLFLLLLFGSSLASLSQWKAEHGISVQKREYSNSRTVRVRDLRSVPVGHEVHLNDNNPFALIHYSGSDSRVILVATYPRYITTQNSNVYISTDYGTSFTKINTRLETNGILHLYPYMHISPEDYRNIIIPHANAGAFYVSTDEGQTFRKQTFNPSTINPRSLTFHPTQENWFLAHDPQTDTLYVSRDLGQTFTSISNNVNSTHEYLWGVMPYDTDASTIYYNVDNPNDHTSEVHLYMQKYPYTSATRAEFDAKFGVHDDFLMLDRYIFAQKTVNQKAQLYVSYDRKPFQLAHLPTNLAHQNYYVASLNAMQALVIVEHINGKFNLYLSEETGLYYSLSLPDIVYKNGVIDLEIVDSMNGTTYICNQNMPGSFVRTLISFDAGGNWEMLRPPTADTTGKLLECILPSCSLHLHMSSSDYWRTGVYSTSSAPGIIIAHGMTGSTLNNSNVNLFISRDGGVSWNMTLKSTWGVTVLDYGGLIVAAQDYHQFGQQPSKNLAYSCNEGRSWHNYQFSSTNTVVFGVITEPGEGTAVVSLYGIQSATSGWVVIRVNFTNSFNRVCTPSDYYTWIPYDAKSDTGCLLGASVQIERRNPFTCCLSGKQYSHTVAYAICRCYEEDFECDYGYEHANGITGPCVRDESVTLTNPCASAGVTTYLKSQGYRKIGGDVCSGGVEAQYNRIETSCCADGSTPAVITDKEGSDIAIFLGVLLLIALFIILTMFIVMVILVVKFVISRKSNGRYNRVPGNEDEPTLHYRNRAESPITDDDDDERPLPL